MVTHKVSNEYLGLLVYIQFLGSQFKLSLILFVA